MQARDSEQTVRFADFELDPKEGELRRSGIRLPVQGRPLQVLAILLRSPGELVTVEQLRAELWPANTFVDFEHGVRNAVARLRAVLNDTADRPRFIQTIPRRGYRFVGPVTETPLEPLPLRPTAPAPARSKNPWSIALLACALLMCLAGVRALVYGRFRINSAGLGINSLAVLPLEDLSGDSARDYFADGVTDELITILAKMNSVKLTSRTSVMQYKGVRTKPLPQIARELGVDAVLEGTLSRSGDFIRVTAQLIDARTDRHIWADRYERRSRDILVVEDEIARAIAEQLRGKHNSKEQRHLSANPINPAAHEAYLQGLYLWNRRTPSALEEAIRYFTEAIEKDPRYTEAYAGRAAAYSVLGSWGMEAIPPEVALLNARADAERAVQLDETSAEAHTALASVRDLYEWDWLGAQTEYRRAIELSPSYAIARQWYGQFLCNVGRFEECFAETARAHSLDPAYLIAGVDVGHRLFDARRYAEAIAPIQKVLEFNPDFLPAHRSAGQVYEAKAMYREAISEFLKAVQLSRGTPMDLAALGHAYAVSGHRTEARDTLQKLEELAKRRYVSSYQRALVYVGLGDNNRALEWLGRAFQEHSAWMIKLRVDPRLDPLRGDARFTSLVRRVGLTP